MLWPTGHGQPLVWKKLRDGAIPAFQENSKAVSLLRIFLFRGSIWPFHFFTSNLRLEKCPTPTIELMYPLVMTNIAIENDHL